MDVLNGLLADAGLQEALIGLFGIILTIIIRRASAAFTAATGIAIEEKHQHLAGIAKRYPGRYYPFAGPDPRRLDAFNIFKRDNFFSF